MLDWLLENGVALLPLALVLLMTFSSAAIEHIEDNKKNKDDDGS